MITHQIPIISSQAGLLNDGSIIGQVNESLLMAVLSDKLLSDDIFATRKNVTGTSYTFEDISTEAASEVANSFLPFGTTAQMTAGDEMFLACEKDISEFYVDIDTPGNWVGTFEIRYSSNGITPNQTVQGLVDGSNGLRNPNGVYRISFTPPSDIVPFSPVPGDVASRKWLVLKPIVTSVATAPELRRVWLFHDDIKYTDFTATANGSLTTAPPTGTFLPKVDAVVLYAFSNKAYGLERYVFGSQANVQTRVWEYLASDGTWKTLPGVIDSSSDLTATPTSSPTKFTVRWTPPTDWTAQTLTTTFVTNAVLTTTGYWVRIRTTAVSNFSPTATPLVRTRAKQFGNANVAGVTLLEAQTLKGATITRVGSITGTGITSLDLFNLTTGDSTAFSIPAIPVLPLTVNFADLSLGANDIYGIIHASGTRLLTDVEIVLH